MNIKRSNFVKCPNQYLFTYNEAVSSWMVKETEVTALIKLDFRQLK